MIPLSAPDITEAEIAAVTAVLRSGRLSLGPELEAFEHELAAAHGVADAVAVSSGTAALHLALITLGIGAGDEVILPSFTFIAVANAVAQAGATPMFAEIDAATLNLDPAAVERAITPRTRAILVVHTFGLPAEMDALEALARKYELALIEDACEAVGARFNGQPVGSFGDLAVLGFYPNKQMTTGEGGAVLVREARHAARIRSLRNQGRDTSGGWLDHAEIGYNYRLSELACALGRVQLGRLQQMLTLRAEAAARYDRLLGGIAGLDLPALAVSRRMLSWFVYVVRLPEYANREQVQTALAGRGIATGRYFPPIHRQPAWLGHPSAAIELPVTEAVAGRMLALPFFTRIAPEVQEEVAGTLRAALTGLS